MLHQITRFKTLTCVPRCRLCWHIHVFKEAFFSLSDIRAGAVDCDWNSWSIISLVLVYHSNRGYWSSWPSQLDFWCNLVLEESQAKGRSSSKPMSFHSNHCLQKAVLYVQFSCAVMQTRAFPNWTRTINMRDFFQNGSKFW